MARSLASIKSMVGTSPPVIRICATDGVGRTTFATGVDKPVVVPTEDRFGKAAPSFPSRITMENQ